MIKLETESGFVTVEGTSDEKRRISVYPIKNGNKNATFTWETKYPVSLIEKILRVKGIEYLCDEIRRDEDDQYIRESMEIEILSYLDEIEFENRRILDFGCGCGSSTVVLARIFPRAEIVGCELLEEFVDIAKERARFYGLNKLDFFTSPDGTHLPAVLDEFDFIILSAVFEHLLPAERPVVLPLLWKILKKGGIIFVRETPFRYSLVESHTTGLPFVNFLPDGLTRNLAIRYSKHVSNSENWETLLRRGIRGGTEQEIIKIIKDSGGDPDLQQPGKRGISNRVELWHQLPTSKRFSIIKKGMFFFMSIIWWLTGLTITPQLSLAIKKHK